MTEAQRKLLEQRAAKVEREIVKIQRAIGVTPDVVSEIVVESQELDRGAVKRERAKEKRWRVRKARTRG